MTKIIQNGRRLYSSEWKMTKIDSKWKTEKNQDGKQNF